MLGDNVMDGREVGHCALCMGGFSGAGVVL